MVVTQITAETPFSNLPYNIVSCYWVVRNFGTNLTGLNFSGMRFQIPAGNTIISADEITPANVKLFKRQHNAESIWAGTSAATSANNATKLVQFSTFLTASFSEFVIGSIGTTLPQTVLNFSGMRIDDQKNMLSWKTFSENNTKGFEIETSENATDFTKIAFMEGAGNSNNTKSYNFVQTQEKDAYYRLKQIDLENNFAYSDVIFIKGIEQKVKIYPNPASEEVTIEFNQWENAKTALLEITNLEGKSIAKNDLKNAKTTLDIRHLAKGTYMFKIIQNSKIIIQKVVIQ